MSLIVAAAALVSGGVAVALPRSAAAAPVPDGSSALNAAPSCWAIKQTRPSSASGLYWLQTPLLVTAQQFYCDMTTDGGGWVLVGRGRENWSFHNAGQGTPGQVRNTPAGTGAFAPAALPGATIDGLLNGGSVQALGDGVRLRRATNAGGTAWQEMRWKVSGAAGWSWTFDGGMPLSSTTFGSSTYQGGTTADVDRDGLFAPYNRVWTTATSAKGWKRGFAYGERVSGGSNSSTNHLWTAGGEGSPMPFTQVWIRPKVTDPDYGTMPAAGLPARPNRALVSGATSPTPWGVTGVVAGGSGETNLEVQGIATLGDTVYVGGFFQYVQKGASPAAGEKVQQSYLAAFDARTGEWKSGFRPVLNGGVLDIQAAGDKIIVAGDFASVNGVANTKGLAALDPATGAPVAAWKATLERGSNAPRARALDVQGEWLYVGGTFTHIAGGATLAKSKLWVGGAARVRVTDGTPDTTWNPFFDGPVFDVDASDRGDRVYFGGRFENMGKQKETRANNFTVVDATGAGRRIPGVEDQSWRPTAIREDGQYRQTVKEVGDRVWLGGSEHDLQVYDRDFTRRIGSNITRAGGDFQDMVVKDGIVWGASHGWDYNYIGASTYPDVYAGGGFTAVHRSHGLGAWDAQTGEYLTAFNPSFRSRTGSGIWALEFDRFGCLWFGGDMNRGSWSGTGYQWLGGFGRLCALDHTPPPVPARLRVASTGDDGVGLAWDGVPNDTTVRYEVLRDGRVIATDLRGWNFKDALRDGASHRYVVRSHDTSGNRSASTPVLVVP
ncbi:fibrinogen-like YCDxxxxGGGW domain-containing protein [Thermomonospora umbrina]|uniref:fibrinogen-like YCDxxxxGGGW domain-containing protein n=1 Tax=Thermomonospora umbrina TaxID=111806 RepID=UPI0011C16A51|nr:fibrinogen-like YCDxxxxGGGW domain-containing protein [Thermomonospora umbrina]